MCWLSEVPVFADRLLSLASMGNGNSRPIAARLRGMSVPSDGAAFHAYVAKRTPWDHRKKSSKSAVLMA